MCRSLDHWTGALKASDIETVNVTVYVKRLHEKRRHFARRHGDLEVSAELFDRTGPSLSPSELVHTSDMGSQAMAWEDLSPVLHPHTPWLSNLRGKTHLFIQLAGAMFIQFGLVSR